MAIPPWIDDEFDRLNAEHFQGKLPRPKWGENKMRKAAVATIGPGKHLVWFHPDMLRLMSRKFVGDSMLHELVHVALAEENGDGGQDHGRRFVHLANNIGAKLGLLAVAAGSDAALDWPQSVRPKGYFDGEVAVWKDKS